MQHWSENIYKNLAPRLFPQGQFPERRSSKYVIAPTKAYIKAYIGIYRQSLVKTLFKLQVNDILW